MQVLAICSKDTFLANASPELNSTTYSNDASNFPNPHWIDGRWQFDVCLHCSPNVLLPSHVKKGNMH